MPSENGHIAGISALALGGGLVMDGHVRQPEPFANTYQMDCQTIGLQILRDWGDEVS
jgi:hypothetical protein